MNTTEYVAESEKLYKILNQRRPDPTIQKQYDAFHKKYEPYVNNARELFTQSNEKGDFMVDIHNGDVTKVKQVDGITQLNIDAALFYRNKQVEHKNIVLKLQTDDDLNSLKNAEIHEFIFDKTNQQAIFMYLDKDEQLQSLVVNFKEISCEATQPKAKSKLKV